MPLNLDYFYGGESEQYSFYRIPKVLFTAAHYRAVLVEAKVLYGLLLDRMALSARNGWLDEGRRVFIYFTLEDAMAMMGCGHNKAVRLFADLEQIGLIERRKQGQGRPTRIYVKNFILPTETGEPEAEPDTPQPPAIGQTSEYGKSEETPEVLTSQNRKSALPETGSPDFPKANASAEDRSAQLVFCDLSTPKGKSSEPKPRAKEEDGQPEEATEDAEGIRMEMSVYQDIRAKLIAKGIPAEEIAFIHDAHTDAQKSELFAKVRAGQVRVLLGSTAKMGAGTNVQTRLVSSHDLDCPWRPADLEQRAGRIVRRGNENESVCIYRYVTKGTFDAYNWGLVENKQKFIGQLMSGKSPARSIEDVDATALSYAEVKMLATGDPRIKEKMDLDIQVAKLKLLKSNHMAMKYEMEDKVLKYYPAKMAETRMFIRALGEDQTIRDLYPVKEDSFAMTVQGQT